MSAPPPFVQLTVTKIRGIVRNGKHCRILFLPGEGKSTSLTPVSGDAIEDGRGVVIMVERRQTAVELLERFTQAGLSAGLFLGFDAKYCDEHRQVPDGTELGPFDKGCGACRNRAFCVYGSREDKVAECDVLIGTRDALILAMAKNPAAYHDRLIIVDEDLKPHDDFEITVVQVEEIARYLNRHNHFVAGNALKRLLALLTPNAAERQWVELLDDDMWEQIVSNTAVICKTLFGAHLHDAIHLAGVFNPAPAVWQLGMLQEFLWILRKPPITGVRGAVLHTKRKTAAVLRIRREHAVIRPSLLTNCQWVILSATTLLSLTRYPPALGRVIRPTSHAPRGRLRLHVVSATNTRSALDRGAYEAALARARQITHLGAGDTVLAVTSKSKGTAEAVEAYIDQHTAELATALGIAADQIIHMSRGSTRGENIARDAALVFLGNLPLFTAIEDYVMTVVMQRNQSMSVQVALRKDGKPDMANGLFRQTWLADIQRAQMLDEFIQTVYRGRIRQGQDMDAIVVLPHPMLIRDLWMAGYTNIEYVPPPEGENPPSDRYQHLTEALLWVLRLPAGTEIQKAELAERCGYTSYRAGKHMLTTLFDGVLDMTHHSLVRTPTGARPTPQGLRVELSE